MDIFFKDSSIGLNISWSSLINDLNSERSYYPFCSSEKYYEIFKQIIISMITGAEITLLDSDLSETEIVSLTGYEKSDLFKRQINAENIHLSDKGELIENLKKTNGNWTITLFTSGTTGTPKKITHNFDSIARFVKYSERNKESIWGFAYNPTHIAGLQVFLQALLNGNTIVRLFGLSPEKIRNEILSNQITHISATPTFYKLLLPCEERFPSVRRITSGGEKFNSKVMNQLSEIFPNARITNVYASTEAGSLFASNDDIFTIKSEYASLIKIENDELIIHRSLMGSSDANSNEWYHTGDVIETISTDPFKFRFASRKSDMINVGGYKVNPVEVEEAILSIPEIKEARVFAKSNSVTGNIICCEIVCDDKKMDESHIRSFLQPLIQEFKIPRIILFVDQLSITRTGKTKRI